MSARDDLNRYEQDWERHERWIKPLPHENAKPGEYVDKERGGGLMSGPSVRFREMPSSLQERVAKRLESVVAGLVQEEHAKMLAELRERAVAEAKRTLAELEQSGP